VLRIFLRAILTHLLVDIFITNQLFACNNPYRRPKRPFRFFLRTIKDRSALSQAALLAFKAVLSRPDGSRGRAVLRGAFKAGLKADLKNSG